MNQSAMATAYLPNVTAIILKVIGLTICVKVKAPTSIMTRISFLSVSGSQISQKMVFIPRLMMKTQNRDL
jgi:hypothetical protein